MKRVWKGSVGQFLRKWKWEGTHGLTCLELVLLRQKGEIEIWVLVVEMMWAGVETWCTLSQMRMSAQVEIDFCLEVLFCVLWLCADPRD